MCFKVKIRVFLPSRVRQKVKKVQKKICPLVKNKANNSITTTTTTILITKRANNSKKRKKIK